MSGLPFVVGQWVRGAAFYGRRKELLRALDEERRWVWFAGLRRVGKSSLLREVELRAATDSPSTVPVMWDLQGVDDEAELLYSFQDAVLDAEEELARHGLSPGDLSEASIEGFLGSLLEDLQARSLDLLLLIDEADALDTIGPEAVARLWKLLERGAGHRVVLASSLPLCDLPPERRSALLPEGTAGPFWLGPLAPEDSRALLAQGRLPARVRPTFDPQQIERIRDLSGDHPMLLQLLGRRCFEVGDPDAAFEQLTTERTVDHLIAVDFDLIRPEERDDLRRISAPSTPHSGETERLERLGLLRRNPQQGPEPGNAFLDRWLRQSTLRRPALN